MTDTTDHDQPAITDVALLAWRRDMTRFRQINLTVQGADEAGCIEELYRTLGKFTADTFDWELVSARYTQQTVQLSQNGDTTIVVWSMDAVLVTAEGLVPWSGLD